MFRFLFVMPNNSCRTRSYFSHVKDKPIEIVNGSSLSSIIGSTSRFFTSQVDHTSPAHHPETLHVSHTRTRTEVINLPVTTPVAHHRSNTLPIRHRKRGSRKIVNQQTACLSPANKREEQVPPRSLSQPFSPSLLQAPERRRIRVIDDTDEGESPSSTTLNRDD
jgi:hypothetical protein